MCRSSSDICGCSFFLHYYLQKLKMMLFCLFPVTVSQHKQHCGFPVLVFKHEAAAALGNVVLALAVS